MKIYLVFSVAGVGSGVLRCVVDGLDGHSLCVCMIVNGLLGSRFSDFNLQMLMCLMLLDVL